ncbi:putative MATE family efflux protein [Solibacillus kalamii]|uniref:Na+-driven multidrug efflux pump n=2 Tax=Solibacillus TaxID=648800 RepID=F2F534_SOLSS|nr:MULTISPECIES: MATE family efflux transporter [Solibacillus]MBM7667034.1 putative MATE family efflux protein [Solibacillus kalamii]OUZ38182.1 MATE family efflux transporter [Solibacillus kalamii]BAK16999.1 Na+-driven multidrug efflux pump [Solibacillus silvestris StLB046]
MENSTKELSLFKLTWPLFLELFLFMLMGLADTFMLSAVSDDAVAGVGTANQYIQIAILLLGVIGTGASIVVSQYLGSRLIAEASQIAALSVTLNLLVGLVISGLFILFSDVLMKMMNLQGAVLEAAQSYLVIVGGFIFVQALITSMSSIIRVQGWTKQTMYVSLAMNIVHVVLNYILIFGKFGMPELGVEGAAISSVVSRVLASVVFFWLLYQALEVRIEWADYYRLSKNYISKILKIGIPSALEQVLYQTNQIVLLYYVTFIGAEALSARQYAVNISMFTYLFAMAIGMATAILVGRYVGAGEKELAYSKVWFGVKSALIFTLSMVAIIILFREPFMRIFTDNEEIIQIGASVLLLSILLETGRTINITIINSLRASGDAAYPVRIGFISMIVIGLSLGYLFVFVLDLGLVGVWLAIACDEWIRAVLVIFRWRSRKWERYAIVSSDK